MVNRVKLHKVKQKCSDKGGRWQNRKGSPNRTTRILKDAILLAAELHGEDGKGKGELVGYLKMVARRFPKSYCTLLAKVLPYHITSDQPDQTTMLIMQALRQGRYEDGEHHPREKHAIH